MINNLLRILFNHVSEICMVPVTYEVLVIAFDRSATLKYTSKKQFFVPREDDFINVTQCDDLEINAIVENVSYDPIEEKATVYAETSLNFNDGQKIACIVEKAKSGGWELVSDITYHSCCQSSCPCSQVAE